MESVRQAVAVGWGSGGLKGVGRLFVFVFFWWSLLGLLCLFIVICLFVLWTSVMFVFSDVCLFCCCFIVGVFGYVFWYYFVLLKVFAKTTPRQILEPKILHCQ